MGCYLRRFPSFFLLPSSSLDDCCCAEADLSSLWFKEIGWSIATGVCQQARSCGGTGGGANSAGSRDVWDQVPPLQCASVQRSHRRELGGGNGLDCGRRRVQNLPHGLKILFYFFFFFTFYFSFSRLFSFSLVLFVMLYSCEKEDKNKTMKKNRRGRKKGKKKRKQRQSTSQKKKEMKRTSFFSSRPPSFASVGRCWRMMAEMQAGGWQPGLTLWAFP